MTTPDKLTDDQLRYEVLRNRFLHDFGFHPATEVTRPMHEAVRANVYEMAEWIIENTPQGRDQSLALTALEDVAMRCNKAIATQLAPLE